MYDLENDLDDALADGETLRTDQHYDRNVRAWCTMIIDSREYQVGDAAYDGTRSDAAASLLSFQRAIVAAYERAQTQDDTDVLA